MALIGTLRSKMGTWVVVFVFVAIAAFVVGDIFSGNSSIMSWGSDTVGEIAGEDISMKEYQNAIQEREQNFILQNGREPGEREMIGLRAQAWDMLIARHAIVPQHGKVGIMVTKKEVTDMISGKNIYEGLQQSFVNQQTGQFDRAQLGQYLQYLRNQDVGSADRVRWDIFEKDLKPARERLKYENLLLKSIYVTKAEAEREFHLQSDVSEVRYLYVPYYTVSDSIAKVTDEDLKSYYNKNKEKYRTKEVRDLKYVSFPVVPSAEDSAAVREELARAVNEFKTSGNDSVYASIHSEGQNFYQNYTVGNLPESISQDDLKEGNVIGPVQRGDTYSVIKVSKVFRDTVYAARAKHILIRWTDTSDAAKKEAKEQARNIIKEIKGGADFGMKALEHGTDGTKQRGGDLGWFNSGDMVKPFEEAVFRASKPGLLDDVVETEFGYHIIEVTNVKSNAAYKLAIVEKQITASDETINGAFRKAENFASEVSDLKEFEALAKELGLSVQEAKNIQPSENRFGTVYDGRSVVQWLYRDASVGEVSQVFDLQEENIVAIMTGSLDEGYKPFDMVKNEIKPHVVKEKQGAYIIEKLKSLTGSLDEMARTYGPDANVYSSSDVKLSSNQLPPPVGFDPKIVGAVFSLESGKRTAPIAGESGVIVIEMQNKTTAPEAADYTTYKTILTQNHLNRTSVGISEAIKDNAKIEDQRYKLH